MGGSGGSGGRRRRRQARAGDMSSGHVTFCSVHRQAAPTKAPRCSVLAACSQAAPPPLGGGCTNAQDNTRSTMRGSQALPASTHPADGRRRPAAAAQHALNPSCLPARYLSHTFSSLDAHQHEQLIYCLVVVLRRHRRLDRRSCRQCCRKLRRRCWSCHRPACCF